MASITFVKNFHNRHPDLNDFDAVLMCISKLPSINMLMYKDHDYLINNMKIPIQVTKDISFELQEIKTSEKTGNTERIVFALTTDTNITCLKEYVKVCRQEYETLKNDKLGSGEYYYFDHLTNKLAANNKDALFFDKKPFTTNKTFNSLFFEEKNTVQRRVEHFMKNPDWYATRGIPYTLGFMFSGPPGSGKCLDPDTLVLTYDHGIIPAKDVKIGYLLVSDNDIPGEVVALGSGVDTMYKISQSDGSHYIVNSEHILSLRLAHESIIHGDNVFWIESGQLKLSKGGTTGGTTVPPSAKPDPIGTIADIPILDYLDSGSVFQKFWQAYIPGIKFKCDYDDPKKYGKITDADIKAYVDAGFKDFPEFMKLRHQEHRMSILTFLDKLNHPAALWYKKSLGLVKGVTVTVTELGPGKYCGFELKGNNRFALGDCTITHNTSTIKAIANTTKRHIVNVRLGEIKTNTQLKSLFYDRTLQVVNPETTLIEKMIVPIHQRLYVIEDIDCMTDLIKKREFKIAEVKAKNKAVAESEPEPQFTGTDLSDYYSSVLDLEKKEAEATEELEDKITLDTLLNILDGTLEVPSRMFCITTNHPEVIDSALIRPGRVDMIITFQNASRDIIHQMFEFFYDIEFDIAAFANVPNYKYSPAQINQVMFRHQDDPKKAISSLN